MTPFYNSLFHFESAKLLGELLLKILLTQGNRNHQPRPKNVFFYKRKKERDRLGGIFCQVQNIGCEPDVLSKVERLYFPFPGFDRLRKKKKLEMKKKVEIANVERRTTSNASPSRLRLRQRLREWDATSKPRTSNRCYALSFLDVQKTDNPSIVLPHTL